MSITQFSEQEWIKIMSPALGPTLQKAGISKNAPRSALYAPDCYQGFGIMNPYLNQEISHIIALFQESVANSQTGKLLRLTAESFRLELGLPLDAAYNHSICSAYTTDCW